MRDDLISSFHTDCVKLYKIQKGALKIIKEIGWNDIFVGVRSVDLCSHGITTSFDSQSGNNFIGIFYLEESYLKRMLFKNKYIAYDGSHMGDNQLIVRIRYDEEIDNF